ncbi:MAG: hypothetical protein ACE5EF_00025 [Dehalococcoidia bacterium]
MAKREGPRREYLSWRADTRVVEWARRACTREMKARCDLFSQAAWEFLSKYHEDLRPPGLEGVTECPIPPRREAPYPIYQPGNVEGLTPLDWVQIYNEHRPEGAQPAKVIPMGPPWRNLVAVSHQLQGSSSCLLDALTEQLELPLNDYYRDWGSFSLPWLLKSPDKLLDFLNGAMSKPMPTSELTDEYRRLNGMP